MCSGKLSCSYSKESCCQALLNLYPQVQTLYSECPKESLSDVLSLLAYYIKPIYDRLKCGTVFCCQGIVDAYLCAVKTYLGNDTASLCQLGAVLGCILSQAGFVPPVLDPASLILDDGSIEYVISAFTQQWLWLNRFTPSSYPFILEEIQVYFASIDGFQIGDPIDLYVWENSSGNFNPANGAVFRGSLIGQKVQSSFRFNSYPLPSPIYFNGPGDILIGVVNRLPLTDPRYLNGYSPAAIDANLSQHRSWFGSSYPSNTAPNPPTLPAPFWDLIDNVIPIAGFGNWMIRGIGCGGSQSPLANPPPPPIVLTLAAPDQSDQLELTPSLFSAIPAVKALKVDPPL